MPSRALTTGEVEGSPVVLKEALAVGVPVVATRTGGTEEVMPPEFRAELVPPDDAEALAARLEAVLSDRASWDERARIGRRWVEASSTGRSLVGALPPSTRGWPARIRARETRATPTSAPTRAPARRADSRLPTLLERGHELADRQWQRFRSDGLEVSYPVAETDALAQLTSLELVRDGEYRHIGDHGQDRHVHSGGDDDVELAEPLEQLPGRVEGVSTTTSAATSTGRRATSRWRRESSIQYSGTP